MTFTVIILLVLLVSLALLLSATVIRVQLAREQTQSSITRIQTFLDNRQNRSLQPTGPIQDNLNDSGGIVRNNEDGINTILE